MKCVALLTIISVMGAAQTANALEGCRQIEYAELKDMTTQQLAAEVCENFYRAFNLETSVELGAVRFNYQKRLADLGGPDRLSDSRRAVEIGGAVVDAQNELKKCTGEMARIDRILNSRKDGKASLARAKCAEGRKNKGW